MGRRSKVLIGALLVFSLFVWGVMQATAATVDPGGKGDLLIYPLYIAGDGIQTNFYVTNTSDDQSVVAKVVLRSHKYSQEVLDFLIYLSPHDVFSATISYKDGKYVLTSTDDSFCTTDGVCASETNPFEFELTEPCDGKADDSASYGYIEIIEAGSVGTDVTGKNTDGSVDKKDIVDAYWDNFANFKTGLDAADTLTGYAEVVFPGYDYAAYPATAIKDYGNRDQLGVTLPTTLGKHSETSLGDLDSLLAKNSLVVPVSENAIAIPVLTFPTKLSSCPDNGNVTNTGPFFAGGDDNTTYELTYYDLSENTTIEKNPIVSPVPKEEPNTLPEEVNIMVYDFPFNAGWTKVKFTKVDNAPVIGLVAEFTENGYTFLPVAYDR